MKALHRSFAAGELADEVRFRPDLVQQQTGARELRNVISLPHGPITSRPGFRFVGEVRDSTRRVRLVPFVFSPTQTLVLEFGHLYVRFISDGAYLVEPGRAITAATTASPAVVTTAVSHGFADGDHVHLSGIVGPTDLNGRVVRVGSPGASTFQVRDMANNPISTIGQPAYVSGGAAARVYMIATPYTETDLMSLKFDQANDIVTITHPAYQQRELRRLAAVNWTLAALTFTPSLAAPAPPTVTIGAGSGSIVYAYAITALASGTLEESPLSGSNQVSNNLAVAGNHNLITPPALPSGAVRFNVYRRVSGIFGYVGQTDGSVFRDENIQPDLTRTPPIVDDPFTSVNNYPAAVGRFAGRRMFGGTLSRPLGVWGTRSGTERNMDYSIPLQDDDRIALSLNARQAHAIRHIVAFTDLLLLTSGSEWVLFTPDDEVMTITNVVPRQQGAFGASEVTPVLTNVGAVYVQDRGGRVRQLLANDSRTAYRSEDLSLLAFHLFDGRVIVDMAFARMPHPTVWCARDDGVLLGLTYVPEQHVAGWHRHVTDGAVESVCVVPEGDEDILYAVVRRTVGARSVRYIERMAPRLRVPQAQSFFVDSGMTYQGPPTQSVAGLWHLEGRTVAILADGAVEPQQVVTNGRVTFPSERGPASVVSVGLPYTQRAVLFSPVVETPGLGLSEAKSIAGVWLLLTHSAAPMVGVQGGVLRPLPWRFTEPFGSPPSLKAGAFFVSPDSDWATETSLVIEQSDPLPITLNAVVMEVEFGG